MEKVIEKYQSRIFSRTKVQGQEHKWVLSFVMGDMRIGSLDTGRVSL